MKGNKAKDIFGLVFLVILLGFLFENFRSAPSLSVLSLFSIFFLAGSAAIIAETVSVFWLWKEERVKALEDFFGLIGHIPHCGYCFCLWLAALYVGYFRISLFPGMAFENQILEFLLSWWGLSFLNVLFFEVLTVLWLKKVEHEFNLRNLYKGRKNQ